MKLPKGVLANAGKAVIGAGKAAINPQTYRNAYNTVKNVTPVAVKVAVPVGAAAGGTVAMNQAHKLGA